MCRCQVIGVGASVIGDMSSRPNWGLNELDFVFATLVVRPLCSNMQLPERAAVDWSQTGHNQDYTGLQEHIGLTIVQ